MRGERGIALWWFLAGIAALFIAVAFTFDACIDDESEREDVGMEMMDRGDGDDNRGGRNDNGRECEDTEDCSSFSPSFEDSPVILCLPDSTCNF